MFADDTTCTGWTSHVRIANLLSEFFPVPREGTTGRGATGYKADILADYVVDCEFILDAHDQWCPKFESVITAVCDWIDGGEFPTNSVREELPWVSRTLVLHLNYISPDKDGIFPVLLSTTSCRGPAIALSGCE